MNKNESFNLLDVFLSKNLDSSENGVWLLQSQF